MRVVHVISSLNDGGAEAVLFRLCTYGNQHEHFVVSMQDDGKYGSLLEDAGIHLETLKMPRGRVSLHGLLSLFRFIRTIKPDAVQTWMYHADVVGGVIARLAGVSNVIWGVHNTNLDRDKTKLSTRLVARLAAILSFIIPRKILSCSQRGVVEHTARGYSAARFVVVPNGYDTTRFVFDQAAAANIRASLNLSDDIFLIGMVARYDPQKDHANLINALQKFHRTHSAFHCILVGGGVDASNHILLELIKAKGLESKVSLLGSRADIPAIMSAIDLHVLSSSGEAFPNVLCEAMACGTLCLTTDVGDAAVIVADIGWVVPAANSVRLADALVQVLELKTTSLDKWEFRRSAAVKRIRDVYGLNTMANSYSMVWRPK